MMKPKEIINAINKSKKIKQKENMLIKYKKDIDRALNGMKRDLKTSHGFGMCTHYKGVPDDLLSDFDQLKMELENHGYTIDLIPDLAPPDYALKDLLVFDVIIKIVDLKGLDKQ